MENRTGDKVLNIERMNRLPLNTEKNEVAEELQHILSKMSTFANDTRGCIKIYSIYCANIIQENLKKPFL